LTNEALLEGDHPLAADARGLLFDELGDLGGDQPQAAQMATKAARNELQRLYMQHGWYAEAAEVARAARSGQPIDFYCANRESVVRQSLARVLLEAGDVDGARAELGEASRQSRVFLAGVRTATEVAPRACEQFGQRASAPTPVYDNVPPAPE